ncbi:MULTISPECIES: tripartite tricarboxylate transporter TctB family protein [unclassified Yoonia]|uniref:tripartite tricarboxylate transporter TctB family protein n=1 Tax=unclassified Yoonia TaxID=2629118 RepID=UPI002AFF0816|nr:MULTISPECIES: tripartite tricarboxylate transporter TctB family protein [unclassified Yoonia]
MSILPNRRVVWGHLALVTVIVGITIAYIFDARGVSTRATNLLLIQPLAVLIVILAAFVLPGIFPPVTSDEAKMHDGETRMDLARALGIIVALGVLAFTLERIGFDIATFGFMVVTLAICGERRWWVNLGFSAIFTVALIYGYGAITPFPFPLTVL